MIFPVVCTDVKLIPVMQGRTQTEGVPEWSAEEEVSQKARKHGEIKENNLYSSTYHSGDQINEDGMRGLRAKYEEGGQNLKEGDNFKEVDVDVRIMFEWALRNQDGSGRPE